MLRNPHSQSSSLLECATAAARWPYQFAAIFWGMAPLICTALVAMTGSVDSVAALVIGIALVSLSCSYLMTETFRTGLRNEKPTPATT